MFDMRLSCYFNDTFKLMKMSFGRLNAAVCPRLSLRTFRLVLSDFFQYFFSPVLCEY